MAQIKWQRDELILALNLYLEKGWLDDRHKEVIALSQTLNKLKDALGHVGHSKYRNPNGVSMKLMNFRSLDPAHAKGGAGLPNTGDATKAVWNELGQKSQLCASLANSIMDAVSSPEFKSAEYDEGELEDGFAEASEGRVLSVMHRTRERRPGLAKKKKKQILKRDGCLRCECCGLNFSERYGAHGSGFIECHHTLPLSEVKPGHKTALKDLALVCANCHRMIHFRRPWLSVADLKTLINTIVK